MKLEKSEGNTIKKKRKTDEENEGNRKKVKSGTHKEKKHNDLHKKHKSSPKHSSSRSSHKSSKKPEINSCKALKPEVDTDTKANDKEDAKKEEELQDENNNMNVMENGQSENKDCVSPENVLKTEISEDPFNETSTENQAKVKASDDDCPSLPAVKEEDEVPSLDPVSNKSDPKEKKEKKKVKKEAVKDGVGNLTKDELQGQKNKRNSSTTEDEQRKNKRAKKEKDEDKAKSKEKKETKKEEEEANKWKWWEEGKLSDGQKWSTFEHKGPYFPPEYEPLPSDISFLYNGQPMKLSLGAEEVATFYAKMLDHEYTSKEIFQNNFFTDWQEVMTEDERKMIKKLSKCDFSNIHSYFFKKAEEKRNMSKEEKQVLKEETNQLTEKYGYCLLDGHKEKIGNFRIEPPGLFRGRGEHPKMGKLKRRVQPEDVIINCSEDSEVPQPPAGHRWKRVQHDNTVTWLASWVENIHGHIKYIMLNPSSKLKGEKDWQKYETARKLKESVDSIRSEYRSAWTSREMKQRQRGVALYFIDKLALRAGNEKEDDTADTVGCCSLRVEHITLHKHLDDKDYVVEFDFLGKDSIRYYNKVPVEKQVFKNLKLFLKSKDPEDDLFDRISTIYLNKKLNEAMPGLTAKVFRTYNASTTLQDQLSKLTTDDMTVEEKILAYNRANRAVAILCNHQRAAPKTFEKSMLALQERIKKKKEEIVIAKKELKEAKKAHKENPSEKSKNLVEKKEKALKRLSEQLKKLKLQETDREENKVIALGTSKLNYLDPRITVAW